MTGPIGRMYVFSWDTETFLVCPGIQAPPVVCLQYKIRDLSAKILQHSTLLHARDPQCKAMLVWALQNARLVGLRVAYDLACAATSWPDLLPLIFRALDEDRVTDLTPRQKLADLAQGISLESQDYGLSGISETHGLGALDKEDPWRTKYGTLYLVDLEDWPEAAKRYALGDADTTDALYWLQEAKYRAQGWLVDEYAQTRAAFMLYLESCWGVRTDLAAVQSYHVETLKLANLDREIATKAGLVRANGTKDTKAAMARMLDVMEALEEEAPLTDSGLALLETLKASASGDAKVTARDVFNVKGSGICLDEDACLASGDEILEAYQRYGSLSTTVGKCERLYRGTELPLQANYNSLVETGRSSCTQGDKKKKGSTESPTAYGVQLQNMPTGMHWDPEKKSVTFKPGIRECFIPRAKDYV